MQGFHSSLAQDDCRKLSEWFASRVDARHTVRTVCAEMKKEFHMNQMTEAIVKAGLAKPKTQQQRVWEMLKDHPDIPASRLAKMLSDVKESSVSSLLVQMQHRGMVHIEKRPMRVPGPHGMYERSTHFYRAIGDKYELKPIKRVPKKAPPSTPKQAELPLAAPAPQAPTPAPQAAAPTTVDINALMVGEAHALYLALKKLFG
jgi:hypothetical protein